VLEVSRSWIEEIINARKALKVFWRRVPSSKTRGLLGLRVLAPSPKPAMAYCSEAPTTVAICAVGSPHALASPKKSKELMRLSIFAAIPFV